MSDGEFLRTSCGSPNYAAPEVISGRYCYCFVKHSSLLLLQDLNKQSLENVALMITVLFLFTGPQAICWSRGRYLEQWSHSLCLVVWDASLR